MTTASTHFANRHRDAQCSWPLPVLILPIDTEMPSVHDHCQHSFCQSTQRCQYSFCQSTQICPVFMTTASTHFVNWHRDAQAVLNWVVN